MPLTVITLNIEGDKHLSRFPDKIAALQPDVLCLQEVFAVDIPHLEKSFEMHASFVPGIRLSHPNRYGITPRGKIGIALLTRQPHTPHSRHYVGSPNHIPTFVESDPNAVNRSLLWTKVEKDGQSYTIATTHFTWTNNGAVSEEQLRDLDTLFQILDEIGEVILCGDFNAPRGKETHNRLSARYTDNVPPHITTTIDGSFHIAGHLPFVVDGIFTSTTFQAKHVQIITGVSDHCGILAEISHSS